jgi:hypothetical protein
LIVGSPKEKKRRDKKEELENMSKRMMVYKLASLARGVNNKE